MTAGEEFDLDEVITVRAAKIFIVQFGEFGSASVSGDYVRFILLLVSDKPVLEVAFRFCRFRTAEGPVGFVNVSGAERFAQALQRLAGFGEDAHSADGAVQTVGHSHKDFTGLGIAPGDVGLERLGQAFVARLVALDYLPDLLVYDDQVVVFKKNPGLKVPDLIV